MAADNPRNPFRAEKFETLGGFLRGYLHQDFQLEHGTPEEALAAYCREASVREVRKLEGELERFLDATKRMPFERVQELISTKLGSGWLPQTPEELAGLLVQLRKRLSVP